MDTYQPCLKAEEQVWCDGSAELGKLSHWVRKCLGPGFILSHRPNAGKPPCSHLQKYFMPPSTGLNASSPSLSHQPEVFTKHRSGPHQLHLISEPCGDAHSSPGYR